jgi:tyrosyl-tRNA synthetase
MAKRNFQAAKLQIDTIYNPDKMPWKQWKTDTAAEKAEAALNKERVVELEAAVAEAEAKAKAAEEVAAGKVVAQVDGEALVKAQATTKRLLEEKTKLVADKAAVDKVTFIHTHLIGGSIDCLSEAESVRGEQVEEK